MYMLELHKCMHASMFLLTLGQFGMEGMFEIHTWCISCASCISRNHLCKNMKPPHTYYTHIEAIEPRERPLMCASRAFPKWSAQFPRPNEGQTAESAKMHAAGAQSQYYIYVITL